MTLPSDVLSGLRVVSLAVNVPGPVAAARLRALGAAVRKVEPPGGDPLARAAPGWYARLAEGQEVVRLDLKDPAGRDALDGMLAGADLLLLSHRPAALERLGLGPGRVRARHPDLVAVAIPGYPPPEEDRAGHDLTYQAALGLLSPPALPRTLVADLAAAERAVSTALALLWARERGAGGAYRAVAISDAAEGFGDPLRHGLTGPGDALGGGDPLYGLYPAAEGWVAVAALEPHFRARLLEELGLPEADEDALRAAFRARTAAAWEAWAHERDVPLAAVRTPTSP